MLHSYTWHWDDYGIEIIFPNLPPKTEDKRQNQRGKLKNVKKKNKNSLRKKKINN